MSSQNENIKSRLQEKIKKLETEILKYKQALGVIEELDISLPTKSKNIDSSDGLFPPETPTKNEGRRLFLFEIVEKILKEENQFLSSRDIMNKVNKYYGNNKYDFNKNWSGTFSQAYRKPKSKIKQYKIQDVPAELSSYYGLENWFVNSDLMPEYMQKIKSHYNV